MLKRISGALFAALLLCTASAQAAEYKLTFTASDFTLTWIQAPQNLVTGAITYSAATASDPWTAVTGIELTIAGHTYSSAEVGFISYDYGAQYVGGQVNGVDDARGGTNDFLLGVAPGYFSFMYVSDQSFGFFQPRNLSISVAEVSAVPEPETYVMLLAGLGLLGVATRRRKA